MWKLREKDVEKEKALIERKQDRLVARLVAQREGIDIANLDNFLLTPYENLSHPHTLKGIKEAVDIFCQTVKDKGTVAVFADYDCDGIFSSLMLHELCVNLNHECKVFLPSRLEHGYGLNKKGIKAFKEMVKTPPDLFIAVDCGSNNEEEVLDLKEWGVKKIIIIDHHIVEEDRMSKSADVLVNWHLSEDTEEMCACGEVFQFIRGIRWLSKRVNPLEYITYAAIGTIADVSPIKGDNRIIVRHGLNEFALSHVVSSGLHALINTCYINSKSLTIEDVSFKIAPRINASGRIDSPLLAYDLLRERNVEKADLMASNLNEYNTQRKELQKQIIIDATERVRNNPNAYKHGILIHNDDWHIGVLGIVASRLVETFQVPVIIVGKAGETYKGSGRSLENINLKDILDTCSELFEAHGGHAMAAGVTLKKERLADANAVFNEACRKHFDSTVFPSGDSYYDATLKANSVSMDVAKTLLSSVYPYCKQNNPEPVFRLSDIQIDGTDIKEGKGWRLIKFFAKKDGVDIPYQMKMFSMDFGAEINGRQADVYFSFPQNFNVNNPDSFQLNLIDVDLK